MLENLKLLEDALSAGQGLDLKKLFGESKLLEVPAGRVFFFALRVLAGGLVHVDHVVQAVGLVGGEAILLQQHATVAAASAPSTGSKEARDCG